MIEMFVFNLFYIVRNYFLEKFVFKELYEVFFGGVKGDEILKEIVFLVVKLKIFFLVCEMGYD